MSDNDKALALLGGSAAAEWFPAVRATADGANRLTQAIVTMAYHALEEERKQGSEIPALMSKTVDTETGVMTETVSLTYEAVLRERALAYLQSLKLEADASMLEILADVFERQLYMYHPDQWESLADFLRNMAAGRSTSYQSVIERLVTVVLPFLQVNEMATIKEMMTLVTEGGLSNLYHLLPEMLQAVDAGDGERLGEMLTDAKSLGRTEIYDKWKRGKMRVEPAPAVLRQIAPHMWTLTIAMDERQKQLVLGKLGNRVKILERGQ